MISSLTFQSSPNCSRRWTTNSLKKKLNALFQSSIRIMISQSPLTSSSRLCRKSHTVHRNRASLASERLKDKSLIIHLTRIVLHSISRQLDVSSNTLFNTQHNNNNLLSLAYSLCIFLHFRQSIYRKTNFIGDENFLIFDARLKYIIIHFELFSTEHTSDSLILHSFYTTQITKLTFINNKCSLINKRSI